MKFIQLTLIGPGDLKTHVNTQNIVNFHQINNVNGDYTLIFFNFALGAAVHSIGVRETPEKILSLINT